MTSPKIMGIVNVTPDSFSDGGAFLQTEKAISHGKLLLKQGADLLDVGGESTRPGAREVSANEETGRVEPVISALAHAGAAVSVDTRKPDVMRAAARAGAAMVNDVTALTFDDNSVGAAKETGLPVCLMHAQGTPETMQDKPAYGDVVLDVYDYLLERVQLCVDAGINRSKLIVDPGIGFGKTFEHNMALINQISLFHGLGLPILLGASRKSFIGEITGQKQASQRVAGSVAIAQTAVRAGVQFLRVHDVVETRQALQVVAKT